MQQDRNKICIEILDFLVSNPDREFTAAEIVKGVNIGNSQTILWLKQLRNHIDQKKPYSKFFKYTQQRNEVTHQKQFVYRYDEN